MTIRISTASLFQGGLNQLLARQAQVVQTQNQLATGRRVVNGADDPLAAGAAVALDRSIAELDRFGLNAAVLQNRLNLQESLLTEAGDALQRLRELAVQANNATLTGADRVSVSKEAEQIRQRLLSLANSVDAAGRYVFGGSQDDRRPFVEGPAGVSYQGDQVWRAVAVAPELAINDAEPGSEVWMRVPTGIGPVKATMGAGNTGQLLLGGYSVTDAAAWNGQALSVSFTSPTTYDVLDAGGAVIGGGTYTPGDTLSFNGLSVSLSGPAATGDTLAIGPQVPNDIFATVQGFIDALQAPAATLADRARQTNAIGSVLADISAAGDHFIDRRAGGGARLAGLDDAQGLREATALTLKETLSDLRDVNVAEAASRLTQQSTALEAAQASFVRLQGLSLFNYLR
jgi:flagellar hook-associated protein 3 FlgL